MHKRIFPLLLAVLIALIAASTVSAQIIPTSPADTFKIVDRKAAPGSTVNVRLKIANHTTDVAGFVAFIQIDTSKVRFVGEPDSVNIDGIGGNDIEILDMTNYVTFLGRGAAPGLWDFTRIMTATDSTHASMTFFTTPPNSMPIGSSEVLQFQLQVKPYAPLETTTNIIVYSPDDPRFSQYSDKTGATTVRPTLVLGVLEIDTGTVTEPTNTNDPPTIAAITPNVYNVNTGNPVTFGVSASDPDSPQQIVLTASGLPSGATFGLSGSVTGNGSAAGTFNWTPNGGQSGTYIVTFTCTDDSSAAATPRQVTINVGTIVVVGDKIYSASQPGIGPVAGGRPGLTGVSFPVSLSSTRDVYGVQFDFVYNPSIFIVDSLVPTTRLDNFTVYDDIGSIPGKVRVVAFGLNNEKIGTLSSPAICNFWVTVRNTALVGSWRVKFENAFEAISPDPFQPSVVLEVDTMGTFVVDRGGDVNGDGRVDIADMVIVVAYIIGDQDLNLRQFTAADIDENGFVDVIDLQAIINVVYGGPAPTPGNWTGNEAELALNKANIGSSGGTVQLSAMLPTDISGVQVELKYNPDKVHIRTPLKSAMADNLSLEYRDNGVGGLTVLLYPRSGLNRYMSSGSGVILELPIELEAGDIDAADLSLESAIMTDPNAVEIPVRNLGRQTPLPTDFVLAQNYPNPFNPETVIEFAIKAGSDAKHTTLRIYNLLGQPIYTLVDRDLAAGNYSYKWNGNLSTGERAASGVYFYRLTIGDRSETKKMMLLK